MLGSAVIIFREVLEAALIIGLILAVTRDVPGRRRYVFMGLAGGLSGAVLLALFGDLIAPLAQGMGAEIVNASILLTAVVMLSWHLVWMKKHSYAINHHIRQMGAKIESGEQSISVIGFIIGLAILREGSEAVLFLFGLSASGASAMSLFIGALLGLLAGMLVGVIVYFGMARVPLGSLFRVSGWLILLLTAGLAAQASNYLVQADILPALGNRIWDTSQFLSEQSLAGQFLHILIGYVAQPMGIQLVVYVGTIVLVSTLMYLIARPPSQRVLVTGLASLLLGVVFMAASDQAHASHKIYSPYVDEGEVELEMRAHTTFDSDASKNSNEKMKFEAGYGVTDKWFTTIGGEVADNANHQHEYQATFWENIFQLTEQGQYWVDVGAYLEYEVGHTSGSSDQVEGKLLLEKAVGQYVNTANLVLVREVGSNAANATNFEYAWRTKYLFSKAVELGVEIYGEMGELGHFLPSAQQDHRIGPVLSGVLPLGSRKGKWLYEVGYLFGASDAAPDGTLKFNLEYEFRL